MGGWLPRGLALAAVGWCLGVGVWIWIAPIRGEGVGSSAYSDSDGIVQTTAYSFTTTTSFSDHSLLGPVPLLIPFVIGDRNDHHAGVRLADGLLNRLRLRASSRRSDVGSNCAT